MVYLLGKPSCTLTGKTDIWGKPTGEWLVNTLYYMFLASKGAAPLDLAAGLTDLASGKLLEAFARNETYLETMQT